jgi:hypothetical protein
MYTLSFFNLNKRKINTLTNHVTSKTLKSKLKFQTTTLLLLRKLLPYQILHNDPIQSDISPCQHLFAYQLGIDELLEFVLVLHANFWEQALGRHLLYAVELVHVLTGCFQLLLELVSLLFLGVGSQT